MPVIVRKRNSFIRVRLVLTMKTKAEKRKWWNKLNAEQQNGFIAKNVEDKRLKRNIVMAKSMKRLNLKYDCKLCIHGLTESCIDKPKNGCLYFADETNKVFGPKAI